MDYENKLKPYGAWILAKLCPIEKISAGGIYIPTPEGASERSTVAEVIAMGPGLWNAEAQCYDCIDLEVGQKIYYGIHAGIDVTDELILIKESEVLGVIKG